MKQLLTCLLVLAAFWGQGAEDTDLLTGSPPARVLRVKQLADSGNHIAQLNYGKYILECATPVDYPVGLRYLTNSAQAGCMDAMMELGAEFSGIGNGHLKQDNEIAAFWYVKAAERGNTHAMMRASETLSDPSASSYWLNRALELGSPEAFSAMGAINRTSGNYLTAKEWFEKAHHYGPILEMISQAKLHANSMDAYEWSRIGFLTGDTSTSSYQPETYASFLTSEQITAAEAVVREYISNHHLRIVKTQNTGVTVIR